ncbi:MAG: trypsin-like peptidase domain-containing protein [Defluviitaleaceae bacterium]|nr:trypsin-like peptidase domain-containing protein [Defluviitaleaceae bacterium]
MNDLVGTARAQDDPGAECFRPLYLPFVDIPQHTDAEAEGGYNVATHAGMPGFGSNLEEELANGKPESSRFYSETILSKQRKNDLEAKFFRQSRFAVIVAVFFITGGVFVAMGVMMLLRTDSPDAVAATQPNIRVAVAESPAVSPSIGEADGQFTLGTGSGTGSTAQRSFNSDYIASAWMVSNHIVELVAYIEPSVAAISTTGASAELFTGNPFRGFGERPLSGSGSGILFAADDERVYIVTNAHVIESANNVEVRVMGSSPVNARLVGMDTDEDLAVISIMKADFEGAGLTQWSLARFGDSDEMQVGQMVIAIGNALGGGNTATNGVISAREQRIMVEGRLYTVLQTNAAINPGNSGGPLVNMDGEIVGINTAKISRSYNVEGMGYSITANSARPVIERFMNRISDRAFLGVTGQTISGEIAEMYGLPGIGVFVESVLEGTPAQAAGIESGDIITSFDGETVMSMESLQESVARRNVGDSVAVRIIRGGSEFLSKDVVLDRLIDTSF